MLGDAELSWFLWGGRPPATLTAQLYTYVSRLRRALGPGARITRGARGYALSTGTSFVDLFRFRDLAERGGAALAVGRHRQAARTLQDALALWRGPALADVSDHLSGAETPALEEWRIRALSGRIEADLALGRHARLVPELTGLTDRHPLHEGFRAQLMAALDRGGRRAEALAVYDRTRRLLGSELGVEPGPLLRAAHQALLTSAPCPARLAGRRY